jgi:Xaa-Pro dipeptidase
MLELPFARAEYEARWTAVHAEMRRRNLDSVVIIGRGGGTYERFQDVYYLTNYYSTQSGYVQDGYIADYQAAAHCAVILKQGEAPILVADDPVAEAALIATPHVVGGLDVIAVLAKAIRDARLQGRVGLVGSDTISAKHFKALQQLAPGIQWDCQDDLVADVRIVKSPAELDCFRYAGETVSAAMTAAFEALQAGASESEAAGLAAREVYRRQGQVNLILISHGPGTAERLTDNPIAAYSDTTPARGDLIRWWVYGPMYKGYWLDPGRTSVVGLKPTSQQRHLIESCADIVEACRKAIRPGVRVQDVAALGSRMRAEFDGAEDQMSARWDTLGHGVGLFWAEPNISLAYRGKHQVFQAGMVASTETFLSVPGVGGAGFEQNFIITDNGTELLTTTPMIWW